MKQNYDDIIKTLKDKKQVIENKEDLDYLNAELELFEDLRAAEERANKEGWIPVEEIRKRFEICPETL